MESEQSRVMGYVAGEDWRINHFGFVTSTRLTKNGKARPEKIK